MEASDAGLNHVRVKKYKFIIHLKYIKNNKVKNYQIFDVKFKIGIKTTAKSDGEDYIINGGKMWTTNGVQVSLVGSLYCLFLTWCGYRLIGCVVSLIQVKELLMLINL